MAQNKYRSGLTDTACPRCGAPIRQHEVGIMVAELPEPVKWVADRRECSRGCLLTADDFAGEPS